MATAVTTLRNFIDGEYVDPVDGEFEPILNPNNNNPALPFTDNFAIIKNEKDYNDIVTMGLPLSNDGKPIPSMVTNFGGMIPKGAKNVDVAKEFLKFLIQPKVCNEFLKTGLGRNIPAMKSIVKNDPWWSEDPHRKAYVEQGLLGPTVPEFYVYNPAYAQVRNEHVWSVGWTDVMQGGMTPQAAAEKALKRVEEIFAKYPIAA